MRILITGGCGFIGSHLTERLIRENHEVSVIDAQACGQKFAGGKPVVVYQLGAEEVKCGQIIQDHKIECIIHLASAGVPKEESASSQILHTNNISLSNILFQAQKHQVGKVIVLSSIAVYGLQDSSLINENAPLNPINEMGRRYMSRELICMEQRDKGLNVILIRTGHIYGPRQSCQDDNDLQQIIESVQLDNTSHQTTADDHLRDYLYIGDLVDALLRVIENGTSPVLNVTLGISVTNNEIQKICLDILSGNPVYSPLIYSVPPAQEENLSYNVDNHLAAFELDWIPRVSLEEGIRRTLEWVKKKPIPVPVAAAPSKDRHWLAFIQKNQQDIAVLAAFLVATLATYLMQYRIHINADWLILYIVIINILYGLRYGSLAIAFSIAARVYFLLFLEKMRVIDLVNDVSGIIYLTMYFVIGISIGYVIDHRKTEEDYMRKELESTKSDLRFVNHMYQKSLDVKSAMQNTIENNTDSFGKSLEIISRLMNAESEMIYSEAVKIIASTMKARTVHIYLINTQRQFLRLAAVSGNLKYDKSIQINTFTTLQTAIEQKKIVINRDLDENQPLVCAPIFCAGQVVAIALIDHVEFKMLTQQFINTLQVMTMLVSNSLVADERFESFISDKKYFHQTLVMRKDWFRRILDAQLAKELHTPQSVFVLKVVNQIDDYRAFSRQVSGLIREQDIMGEIVDDQVGIIIANAQSVDISIIQQRFGQHGIPVKLVDIRDL